MQDVSKNTIVYRRISYNAGLRNKAIGSFSCSQDGMKKYHNGVRGNKKMPLVRYNTSAYVDYFLCIILLVTFPRIKLPVGERNGLNSFHLLSSLEYGIV